MATARHGRPSSITVPTGQDLQINLTNNLSFAGGNDPDLARDRRPVGRRSRDRGSERRLRARRMPQGGTRGRSPGESRRLKTRRPPAQGARVQSFSTEVGRGSNHAPDLDGAPAGHVSARVRHASLDPGPDGPVRHRGGDHSAAQRSGRGQPIRSVTYNAEVPLLFSEIDPVQNSAVNAAVNTAGFSETTVWSGQPGGCGDPKLAALTRLAIRRR